MTGVGTIIPVRVEKAVFGGLFLGHHDGKAILFPHAVPGETAMVRILSEKRDYCTGEIDSITESAGSRVEPACPHFSRCGGCSYLHVPYESELEFKTCILLDSLRRIAGLGEDSVPAPEVIRGERFHYRSHASVQTKDGIQGFFRRGTNDIVSIRETGCLLLADPLNAWIRSHDGIPSDYRIAVDCAGAIVSSLDERPVVQEREGGFLYNRGIAQFFQANRLLRGYLLKEVLSFAGIDDRASFLDIGCGVGFFTLPLAGTAKQGRGIDSDPDSILYARANARDNAVDNVDFRELRSSRLHPGRFNPDLIVMDPPRAGLDRHTRQTVLAMGPPVIVYVSCNPSTFSRDVRDFITGGYHLEKMALVDMFPCTQHTEIVSRLSRGQGD